MFKKYKNSLISQLKDHRTIQYHKMCDTCKPRKTNIHVDCINHDKSNKLITYLHESIEANKEVLKVVEGERSSITYLSQKMNPDSV